jgi:hypothetical protein
MMTWMVDWMVEVVPWGQPSVGRHGWLIGWVKTTFPIVEWSYHVTSMKESNIILLLYLVLGFSPGVLVIGFWIEGFGPRVLDLGFWT